jgi:hypothetical protein
MTAWSTREARLLERSGPFAASIAGRRGKIPRLGNGAHVGHHD